MRISGSNATVTFEVERLLSSQINLIATFFLNYYLYY